MYLVTLGHLDASSCASPLVTLRQLLSPNPSASASVIFFDPHQDGAPASGLPAAALFEPLPPPPPQAATPNASAAQAIANPIVPLVLMRTRLSSSLVDNGPPFGPPLAHASPRHAVDGDADHQRARLHEALNGGARAARQQHLVELREEQRGHGARRDAAAAAQQRRAAEDDRGDRGQQVAVALEGAGRGHDAAEQDARHAIQQAGGDVGDRLVAGDDEAGGAGARGARAD